MNPNVTGSEADKAPAKSCCAWLEVPALLLAIVSAFVIGNNAPPICTWPFSLDDAPPTLEVLARPLAKPAPSVAKPAELAAKWSALRDKAEQDLQVAENILTIMVAQKLPDKDRVAQQRKIDALKEKRDQYGKRLQELAELNPQAEKAEQRPKDEVNADELDIQHRRWLDQVRLQKIAPGSKDP